MSAETKNQPVAKIQVGGVQIAIWKHEGEKGAYFKAGLPSLSYIGDEGTWKTAKSYGDRELINLTKAALLAHSKIAELKRAARAEDTSDQPEDGHEE